MPDDEPILPGDLDPGLRERILEYLAFWGPDLHERAIFMGDPPRVRPDFLAALVGVLRGEVEPPASSAPPLPDVPADAVEG